MSMNYQDYLQENHIRKLEIYFKKIKDKMSLSRLAKEYGVDPSRISRIVTEMRNKGF